MCEMVRSGVSQRGVQTSNRSQTDLRDGSQADKPLMLSAQQHGALTLRGHGLSHPITQWLAAPHGQRLVAAKAPRFAARQDRSQRLHAMRAV